MYHQEANMIKVQLERIYKFNFIYNTKIGIYKNLYSYIQKLYDIDVLREKKIKEYEKKLIPINYHLKI